MLNNTRWILISSFAITLIIFSGVLSYGLDQFEQVRNQSRNIVKQNNTKSELIFAMLSSARERVVDLFAMVNSDDPFDRDDIFLDFNKQGAIFARSRTALLKQNLSVAEKTILEEQGKLTGISVPIQNKLVDLIQTDKILTAKILLNEKGVESQNLVLEQLSKLLQLQQESSQKILTDIDFQYNKSKRLILSWSMIAFIVGGIVAFLVISKTSKIEHRLFDEIEHTRATLTSISDAILRVNNEGKIVYSNDKASSMLGSNFNNKELTEVLGSLINPHIDKKYLISNSMGRYQIDVNNNKIWVEVFQEEIKSEDGSISGSVYVLHDITNIVNAQKNLESANSNLELRVAERTENLQEANTQLKESLEDLANTQKQLVHSEKMASLGGLVAGISHEINTPIGISVTSATNIEEHIKNLEKSFISGKLTKIEFKEFVAHAQQGIDILVNNLNRASELIRSFKQVAVDQSSDEYREIDLHEYCNEIILSLHPKLKNTKINIDNNVSKNIPMFTIPGAIYQIISNLIVNSIIHAFDNESRDPLISLSSNISNSTVTINYTDNGKGLDKTTLKKIFDPFYTTKRGQGGSGLGMNVVYNLVTTSLNGHISITSEQHDGIQIEMILPIIQQGELNEL